VTGRSPIARLRGRRSADDDVIPLRVAARAWFRVSLQTFGGPAGQIAVMHRELVEERRWIGERRFLHALSYCTLLPGPEAQQLAIYIGWLLNGTIGGLIAGGLFVLPGYLAIMALSVIYAGWGDTVAVEAIFAGVAPAVLAIVAHAVVRVSRRALTDRVLVAIAVGAFAALALFAVPFPVVLAASALVGYLAGRRRPDGFEPVNHEAGDADAPAPLIADDALHGERPSLARAARILAIGLVLWCLPVAVLAVAFGRSSIYVDQGTFFGGTALVTFGGAYAVLTFVAQRAVETYGWLGTGDMITGLAMAESTPGPLIMVVQFVGFMGAYNSPGDLSPWVAGPLAATLVTWVTFVPCFLFIYLGAPHVEALRHNRGLASALTGITAAVVGIIANLAVYFALHVLFDDVGAIDWGPFDVDRPELGSFDVLAGAVAALAFWLLFRRRWTVLRALGACAVVGAVAHVVTG
jgi:chromate transporter